MLFSQERAFLESKVRWILGEALFRTSFHYEDTDDGKGIYRVDSGCGGGGAIFLLRREF